MEMSGGLWEEEPSFSVLNDIDKSISTFTDSEDVISLPKVDNEVKNSKINNGPNCIDITTKESICQIDSECLKVSNVNKLSTDINRFITDDSNRFNKCLVNDPSKFYNDFVKPQMNVRHDLEYSFSQLFTDNKPKSEDYIKQFVAGRIANIVDKIRKSKSSSCSDLVNLSTSKYISKNDKEIDDFNNLKLDYNYDTSCGKLNNTFKKGDTVGIKQLNDFSFSKDSRLNGTFSRPGHFSGSIEVLNCMDQNQSNVNKPKKNETYELDDPVFLNTTYQLKKSFSCSGLPDVKSHPIGKSDSLLDIELKLEDSIPSDDERDEFGLPIKRFVPTLLSKPDPEITQIIEKYNVLRASFCEVNDNDVDVDEEQEPLTQVKNPDTVKEPLLPDFHGRDTPPRQIENKSKPKGPMKALVPLQNMTKHVSEKIMSPFMKNKGKFPISATNNTSQVFNDSIDEKSNPVAASTPSSDVRCSRRDSVGQGSHRRSVSAGTTPSKSPNYNNNKISEYPIVSHKSHVNGPANNNSTFKSSKTSINTAKQNNVVKPQIRSSLGFRRPSTAPAPSRLSIRAPQTTKLMSKVQSASKLNDSKSIKSSLAVNVNNTGTTVNTLSSKKTVSQRCPAPLRTSVSSNMSTLTHSAISNSKRSSLISKIRVPGFGKENKK